MNEKNAVRQYQGRRAKSAGENFEKLISDSCDYYRLKKQGEIAKTPEPMRPTKSLGNGKFIAFYEKQAQPDYKGTLSGGRTVIFEAKHTDGDRIEQSRVTNEQAAVLERYSQMGAICFILVSMGMHSFYRVPWRVWAEMKDLYGRKYVRAEELNQFEVGFQYGILHFLDGLENIKI